EALAALDPAAAREGTVASIVDALADPEPARRRQAVRAAASLSSLPPSVASALATLAEDPEPTVRAAAVDAIASAWRFGEDGKPLVPAALALLAAKGEAAAKPENRVGLLRTIGTAAPDDMPVRSALLAAAKAEAPDERLAGLF